MESVDDAYPFLRTGTGPAPIIPSSRSASASPAGAGVTYQCSHLDRNLASAGVVPLGGSDGPSALSTIVAQRRRRSPPHLSRRVVAPDRLAQNALAPLLPGCA